MAIAERFAQRHNMDPEGGLFDDRAGPRPRDQLFFGDRLAGAFDERNQNIERAATDPQGLAILEKDAPSGGQPKRPEGEDVFIHRGSIASSRASTIGRDRWGDFRKPTRGNTSAGWARISDIVDTLLSLKGANFLTGETLHIDGGRTADH
jgi:hypothetical protein